MLTTILRMMWKDWGFAPSLFGQATHFLQLARREKEHQALEGHIRASVVFSQMAFEAYFRDAIRGFIQENRSKIDPSSLAKVERQLASRHVGIREAVSEWPSLLTGKPLDSGTEFYRDWQNFMKYRNALVHGKITEMIPDLGKLAQELETLDQAQLAHATAAAMIKATAAHVGFAIPAWACPEQPPNNTLEQSRGP